MQIDIVRAALSERPLLRQLSELYMYDLSEFDPELEITPHGTFDYSVDRYWQDANRYPYVVYVEGKPGGFALLKRGAYLAQDPEMMDLAEFFIIRRHRRKGVGTFVAEQLFGLFPGRWEIRQFAENHGALLFWRKVIDRYTAGDFKEFSVNNEFWNGTVQYFENS
ncbi:MAG: GNAT family N-acetyltransferase [Chloroflexi bacterium]|nr:GNAT family N-acetyltransferase [Chloroflexota bacterium]